MASGDAPPPPKCAPLLSDSKQASAVGRAFPKNLATTDIEDEGNAYMGCVGGWGGDYRTMARRSVESRLLLFGGQSTEKDPCGRSLGQAASYLHYHHKRLES